MTSDPITLAVLVSGGGTTLQNLIDRIADGSLAARIGCVIASRQQVMAIERAERAGIASRVVERATFDDASSFSREVFRHCDVAGADLVCCAGWLSLLEVPPPYAHRVMNIHPALLPSFGGRGMYGLRVHQAVLDHGCKVSGCTVHFVDTTYDTGPIVAQRTCPVLDDDTPQTLAARVFEEEKLAYPEAVRLFAAGRLRVEGRRVRVLSAGP